MLFYLGAHHPNWLEQARFPLFVSRRVLAGRKRMPVAIDRWALDSGGFTEVSSHGKWVTSEDEYVHDIIRCRDETGMLDWAAPQDWMCEPWILEKTGRTILEHQQLTIESVERLRSRVGNLVIPVLQGWRLEDYHEHLAMYRAHGFCLEDEPVVGIGSVCRRQSTTEIAEIVGSLEGIRLHGFGVKTNGLGLYGDKLHSADSMAWSYRARRREPLAGCVGHINCANCLRFASWWRESLLSTAVSARPTGSPGRT